jgi:hypothetical protein
VLDLDNGAVVAAHPDDPNLLFGAGNNNATLTVFDLRVSEPIKEWVRYDPWPAIAHRNRLRPFDVLGSSLAILQTTTATSVCST